MIGENKTRRLAAILAAAATLGLGGVAIAGAAGVGPTSDSGAKAEKQDNVTGPDADRASAAAEQATGGKAIEVQREDAAAEKADNDPAEKGESNAPEKGEFQTPAGTAYEVEVDKNGKEIEVYLGKDFQVIATHADSGDSQDNATGPDATEQPNGGDTTQAGN